MSTVSEHQDAEATGDAAALEVDVSWLFAEPPAEASVEAHPSSSTPCYDPAYEEAVFRVLVEASLTPSTGSHSDRSSSDDDTDFEDIMKFLRGCNGSRLLQAAKKGAVEEVWVELAAGADVEEREEVFLRNPVLHCAAENGHVEVVRCLLGSGAKVDAWNDWMQTPMHAAAMNIHWAGEERDRAAVVRVLVAASGDPNARDVWGKTPLHWAAQSGDPEVVAALLDVGADRAARDNDGWTPLDCARRKNRQQVVEILK